METQLNNETRQEIDLPKTNIRLGDKFLFDNKPYEVYHIREQHDPKIYLEHTAEDGIRDELTYYQSDIVKALKENKIEMIDKRELIENEVTNHDIIKMWADKPEQEQNKEFNLSDFLADVKANFSAEEKAYLRERLLINFRQNEFSPITFQKNSNISKEGVEKVENFYNTFKQENYTPVSEKDLKEYGFNYASIYVDKNFENKVDNILKAMHYDEDIRTEINEVYLNTKKNIHTENSVNQGQNLEQKDLFKNLNNIDEKAREIIESWYEHTEKVGFDFPSSEEFKKDLEAKTSYTFEIDNYGQPTNLKLKNMTTEQSFKQQEFLEKQIKYLGFGESNDIKEQLKKGINNPENKFNIHISSDKVMKGNKIDFNLNLQKTERGGVFLNSYEAKLTTKQGEERSHTFKVRNSDNVTAKEAINLLEGRAIKINREIKNDETGEVSKEPIFIKLKLKEEKTDYNNYKLEMYNKNFGVDIDNIMKKSNIVGDQKELENVKKHLEKGNITNVTFLHEKKEMQGFAVLNPQWKMLNLYDKNMNRVNSNKNAMSNELQDNLKNNVREQSNKRSL